MTDQNITKGDLIIADRILDKVFTTVGQWHRDLDRAIDELELIDTEMDVDGVYFSPTQKYIDAMDRICGKDN